MHGRLQIILSLSLFCSVGFATLPQSSDCLVFVDDNARGIDFPSGPINLGLVAPAEVVDVLAAICVNPDTKERALIVASHVAYFENDQLFADAGYGLFAPVYTMAEISLADMHFGDTTSHGEVTVQGSHVTHTLTIEVEHQKGDFFAMKKLMLNGVTTFDEVYSSQLVVLGALSSTQNKVTMARMSKKDGVMSLRSSSTAPHMIEIGNFTMSDINKLMSDRRFKLSRTTRASL